MARSPGGDVQAVRFAPTVWGVQWHPEVDEPLFRSWFHDGNVEEAVVEQVLGELAPESERLVEWWRPLGVRFAELARAAARVAQR